MKRKIATLQKEKAWDETRKYPVDPNYRWITWRGKELRPAEMELHHLFNSFKQTIKYSSFKPSDRRWITKNWTHKQSQDSIENLFKELMNRHTTLTPAMCDFIRQIDSRFNSLLK